MGETDRMCFVILEQERYQARSTGPGIETGSFACRTIAFTTKLPRPYEITLASRYRQVLRIALCLHSLRL